MRLRISGTGSGTTWRAAARPSGSAGQAAARTGGRRLACWLAAAALVAGCAEDAPTGARQRAPSLSVVPPALDRNEPTPEPMVIVQRTTRRGTGQKGGGRAQTRQTWKIRQHELASRAGVVALLPGRTGELRREDVAALLPVPVLQLPAIAATAVCGNAGAWRRESALGGMRLVTRGRGDVPFSEADVLAGGKVVLTVRAKWERRRGNWQLRSQEFVDVASGTSGAITIEHVGRRAAENDAPVPVVHCADPRTGYVPPVTRAVASGGSATRWQGDLGSSLAGGLLVPPAAALTAGMCTPTDEAAEAACVAELLKMTAAASVAGVAATVMYTACVVPTPLIVPTCLAATFGYTGTAALFEVARLAYVECKQRAKAPVPCSCPIAMDRSGAPPALMGAGADDDSARSAGGAADDPGAPVALECGATPPPGGGGGGGTGAPPSGGGGGYIEICSYTDHYDGNGNYLYTEAHGCRAQWVQ